MLSRPVLLLILLVLLAVVAVYRLELAMVKVQDELDGLRTERRQLEGEIASLRASLAWLSRPGRLSALAADLGMVPVDARRLVDQRWLQRRDELELAGRSFPVPLPSGHVAWLRARPPIMPVVETGRRP